MLLKSFAPLFLLGFLVATMAQAEPTVIRDLEFAPGLKLDLYLPSHPAPQHTTLLVYVHGGGWSSGTKNDMPLSNLVEQGFPVASVDYRLSTVAPFPAQIHDIKAAIRFLRTQSSLVAFKNIATIGSSAGGHLAALVGVSNGNAALEGNIGEHLAESSSVQKIISLFGASNLESILSQSTPFGLNMRTPALKRLLGELPSERPELAKLASPVTHVKTTSPPLLLIHGDADPQMPYEQSLELQHAYQEHQRPVQLETIHGGKHGGHEFYDEERTQIMVRFLS